MSENKLEQDKLKEYFDNTESIIVIIDKNKQIVFINQFGCELTGYNKKKIIGKDWFKIFTPKEKREELINVFEGIIQFKFEIFKIYSYPIVLRDRSERIILWKNMLIRDQNKEVKAILSIGDDITDRKQLERDLRFEKDLKSKIVDTSPIGIAVVNKQGEIIFANKLAEIVLGLSKEDITSRTYNSPDWKITDYEDKLFPEENLPFSIVKKTKKPVFDVKYAIHRTNGEKIFLNINAAPLFDENRNFDGHVASIENVSEKVKANREIYRLNRAYKMLSECNSKLIQFKKELELFQQICDIIVEIGGYRLAWIGLKKEDDFKLVDPVAQSGFEDGYLERVKITWADTERGKGPTGTAIRTARPSICQDIINDPKFKPWKEDAIKRGYKSSIALPVIIENNLIGSLNIYSTVEDAFNSEELKLLEELAINLACGVEKRRSEEKREEAEKLLKKSEERYRRLSNELETFFDSIPVYIFYKDLKDKYLHVNKAFANYIGLKKEEIIGKTSSELFSKEQAEALFKHDLDVITTNKPKLNFIESINKLTERGWVLSNLIPRYDNNGTIIGVIGSSIDITDLKKVQVNLRESKIKYKRAYNRVEFYKDLFAHDINNILQGILMGFQLIQEFIEKLENISNIIESLKIIETQIHRGSRLVSNICKFSLIEQNKFELNKIDVFNILKNIIERMNERYFNRHLKIKIDTEFKQIIVLTNEFLEDVFENILLNAIIHNDSEIIEMVVRISKEKKNNRDFIKLEFIDNGRGIENHQKNLIFLRADEKKRHIYRHGLGLSLVKKIIDSYQGYIWVENRIKEDYSKGSNFILLLPEATNL